MSKPETPRNYAADILSLIDEAFESFTQSNEEQSRLDSEFVDLTHACELFKMDAVEMVKNGSDMRRNRLDRRTHKDNVERLGDLVKWVEKNKNVISDLKGVRTHTSKIIKIHKDRKYIPRVRKDLTKRFREETERK